jgi:hypothetical protein
MAELPFKVIKTFLVAFSKPMMRLNGNIQGKEGRFRFPMVSSEFLKIHGRRIEGAHYLGKQIRTFLKGSRRMQIFIKTLTGRKQNYTFKPEDKVSTVKQQLQEKEGITVDQIRLIFSGKQLADDKCLQDYNIQPGKTIHMVLQLRGGSA